MGLIRKDTTPKRGCTYIRSCICLDEGYKNSLSLLPSLFFLVICVVVLSRIKLVGPAPWRARGKGWAESLSCYRSDAVRGTTIRFLASTPARPLVEVVWLWSAVPCWRYVFSSPTICFIYNLRFIKCGQTQCEFNASSGVYSLDVPVASVSLHHLGFEYI